MFVKPGKKEGEKCLGNSRGKLGAESHVRYFSRLAENVRWPIRKVRKNTNQLRIARRAS